MPQVYRPLPADHGWPQSPSGAAWPAAAVDGDPLPGELAEWLIQLLDALPGGVLVIDDMGIIRCCNAVAGALLGGEVVGRRGGRVVVDGRGQPVLVAGGEQGRAGHRAGERESSCAHDAGRPAFGGAAGR